MRKRFSSFPKVSDALNGMTAMTRQASVLNPLTIHKKTQRTKALFALGVVCIL